VLRKRRCGGHPGRGGRRRWLHGSNLSSFEVSAKIQRQSDICNVKKKEWTHKGNKSQQRRHRYVSADILFVRFLRSFLGFFLLFLEQQTGEEANGQILPHRDVTSLWPVVLQ